MLIILKGEKYEENDRKHFIMHYNGILDHGAFRL